MGIEEKLVKIGKIGRSAARGICKYSTLGALIGTSILSSNAKAEINMKDILDAALGGYDKPAITQKNYDYSGKTKAESETKAETKYNAEKWEWASLTECLFQGPEFDSQGVFNYFERRDEQDNILSATIDGFRSGPNAYIEGNGVLTMKGADGTLDRFGKDIKDGPQGITIYFNPASLENGKGSVSIEMTNDNSNDNRNMCVGVFNDFEGFDIRSFALFEGVDYLLFEPIPYSGEDGLKMTKDDSGFITVELFSNNEWYPVVATNVLAEIGCRSLVNSEFDNSFWNPEVTGLIFEKYTRHPCDINEDGQVNSLDIQQLINGVLGYYASFGYNDVNDDGIVNAVDVQSVINAVLENN